MREIKFRAWDGEKMVVVNDVVLSSEHAKGFWKENSVYENSEILMQFTGLKDKNGKEIYEGDLVLIRANAVDVLGQEKPHKIVFGNYCIGKDDWGVEHQTACFCIEFCDGSGYCGIEGEETIVIGNIFENPELLK